MGRGKRLNAVGAGRMIPSSPFTNQRMKPALYLYGVDFSGAQDARNKILIAKGAPKGKTLLIEDCKRAGDLPASGRGRVKSLAALKKFISEASGAVFGLDFPFGLPGDLVEEESWEAFILAFPDRYKDPDVFKNQCFLRAGKRELKRRTDKEARTPFSPYNLWLYKQTFYGIREILHPLVRDGAARVLPMQEPAPGRPLLLEVCPASTLIDLDLYGLPYKGRSDQHREARAHILEGVSRGRGRRIRIRTRDIRRKAIEDSGGDALDSMIAAFAAFRALRKKNPLLLAAEEGHGVEGYVYK